MAAKYLGKLRYSITNRPENSKYSKVALKADKVGREKEKGAG